MRVLKKVKIEMGCPSFDYLKAANVNKKISYVDVKYMVDLSAIYRDRIRKLISRYRVWQENYGEQRDVRVIMFFRLEGSLIYKQILSELSVYEEVKSHARFLQASYYQSIKNRGL